MSTTLPVLVFWFVLTSFALTGLQLGRPECPRGSTGASWARIDYSIKTVTGKWSRATELLSNHNGSDKLLVHKFHGFAKSSPSPNLSLHVMTTSWPSFPLWLINFTICDNKHRQNKFWGEVFEKLCPVTSYFRIPRLLTLMKLHDFQRPEKCFFQIQWSTLQPAKHSIWPKLNES